jgi:CheY-like chemotaxis protein
LIVSDNGVGMDRETLSHVFEPFFTTKEADKGTGLGLATVYGIVKQNGGFINVYSEPGHGTTFKIYFPRITAKEGEIKEKSGKAQVAPGTGTVLLVEDDEMVRSVATAQLQTIGYTVLVERTPLEALSLLEKTDTPVDLLFTDVVMPEMKGTELRDRARLVRPGIKVLFMSGYTQCHCPSRRSGEGVFCPEALQPGKSRTEGQEAISDT